MQEKDTMQERDMITLLALHFPFTTPFTANGGWVELAGCFSVQQQK